jgi:hypothetical protein
VQGFTVHGSCGIFFKLHFKRSRIPPIVLSDVSKETQNPSEETAIGSMQVSLSPLCQQQKPPTPVGAVQTSVVHVNGLGLTLHVSVNVKPCKFIYIVLSSLIK